MAIETLDAAKVAAEGKAAMAAEANAKRAEACLALLGATRYSAMGREFAKDLIRWGVVADIGVACSAAQQLMTDAGREMSGQSAFLRFAGAKVGSVTLGEFVEKAKDVRETYPITLAFAITAIDKWRKRFPLITAKLTVTDALATWLKELKPIDAK